MFIQPYIGSGHHRTADVLLHHQTVGGVDVFNQIYLTNTCRSPGTRHVRPNCPRTHRLDIKLGALFQSQGRFENVLKFTSSCSQTNKVKSAFDLIRQVPFCVLVFHFIDFISWLFFDYFFDAHEIASRRR